MKTKILTASSLAIALGFSASAFAEIDLTDGFGAFRDKFLNKHSLKIFGVAGPLAESSTESLDAATAEADPAKLVTAAKSLRVKVVSAKANLGANIDMMALWPKENPTHIIACNEAGATDPGVQRIKLSNGAVETILTGTESCDPVHITPWGTIIVGEEAGSTGAVLELIDPLNTTGVVYDRTTHALTGNDANKVAVRMALGFTSYEGIAVYPNGVVYYGDENRPSSGTAGGAYFKFIPDVLWNGASSITSLDQSPLASGQVYGLRLGLRSGATDYGQGNNTGMGTWVKIDNSNGADLRAAAASLKLTGYYRPEDMAIDLTLLGHGKVRFCGNNTGNEITDHNWGETICITDGTVAEAGANTAIPEVQRLVEGTSEFAMMDNIANQPGRDNWIIHEDGDGAEATVPHNNDIWSCLEDGNDDDDLSDGCVRIITLNDLTAESTGGFFDDEGKAFYFSVQHNITGHGVILKVTNWK